MFGISLSVLCSIVVYNYSVCLVHLKIWNFKLTLYLMLELEIINLKITSMTSLKAVIPARRREGVNLRWNCYGLNII